MSKNFYITTSIVYANSQPHIGFALESIQADVLARYNRLLGKDVFFLTGTDEHGAKIVKAAKIAKKTPKEFVDEISGEYKRLVKVLNLSNNDFIRTTDKVRHWPTVNKVWLKLKEKGDIYKKKYKGFYCVGCEAFITKKDLKDGKCVFHNKEPEMVEEENYFFRLSKYSKKIERIIERDEVKIVPQARKNEILKFIKLTSVAKWRKEHKALFKQGLEDISFSRPRKDLKWAIPVPDDSSASIYVWTDALTNYISALDYTNNGDKFKKFWPADIHCIGKDILRFHGAIWLGMLLSLEIPLPKVIFVHGFITINGHKMSKSLGNVVNPFKLVEKYGTDAVRYFLLREIPSTKDGDYTQQKFEERYNADLANGLGNLVARVITLAGEIKDQKLKTKAIQNPLKKEINKTWKNYKKALDEFKLHEALVVIWKLISSCDKYIEKEKPWENKNQKSKIKNQKVVANLFFTLNEIAKMLESFLPETSEKILKQLETKKSKPLFPRI